VIENDETLIEQVRAHDEQALAKFIDLRRPQLLAFIERRLGAALRRKIEPDDVLQETSAEAIRGLKGAELADRDVFGWLCQMAERRIIDAHRRFASQKRDSGREVPIHSPVDSDHGGIIDLLVASMTTASKAFSRDQKQIRMMAALESLPSEHREALRMRYLEGLPSKDIAARLNKSDGAVRVMLTRSLAKLQELLGVNKGEETSSF
jgi:RNA polymerase sigma-70 factor (ECF subfamily)